MIENEWLIKLCENGVINECVCLSNYLILSINQPISLATLKSHPFWILARLVQYHYSF